MQPKTYTVLIIAAFVAFAVLTASAAESSSTKDEYAEARAKMVEDQISSSAWGRDAITDKAVLDAMRKVPRHKFVPEGQVSRAYADSPLPIGHGQTISQPYVVASMTELVQPEKDDVVLEIGTGSGYQAAVLAEIVKHVYSIEIVEELGQSAAEHLKNTGYENVTTKIGDGYHGWAEHAPYDAIVVTAAASHIPPPLIEQLKSGGRMIIPVGPPFGTQNLLLVEKMNDGSALQRSVMPVRFVPLTRAKEGEAKSGKKE